MAKQNLEQLTHLRLMAIETRINYFRGAIKKCHEVGWLMRHLENRYNENIRYWERVAGRKYDGEKTE